MGSSLDWSREAYTLDEKRTIAVRAAFKRMFDDGLIYRGHRIVNWCPHCSSTLSDDEVEHKEKKAILYTFKYAKDFPFTIATTRPETKLGDTAVAVNPSDERYKTYIGQTFTVDLGRGPQKLPSSPMKKLIRHTARVLWVLRQRTRPPTMRSPKK